MRPRKLAWGLALAVHACAPSGSSEDDAGGLPAHHHDGGAAPASDAAPDAALELWEAGTMPDGSTEQGSDAEVATAPGDASVLDADASRDGGDEPVECPASRACAVWVVEEGTCVEEPLVNGTACGAAHVCVDGACVDRGCGDGFVEPGGEWPREACDDGNLSDGDGCDAQCSPTWFDLSGPFLTPQGAELRVRSVPAVAVDEAGTVLVVGLSESETEVWLWARSLDKHLSPMGDPLLLAHEPRGSELEPAAVGLDHGFLLVHTAAHDGDLTGIQARLLRPGDAPGAPFWLHASRSGQQHRARLAYRDGQVTAAWLETATAELGRSGRVLLATAAAEALPAAVAYEAYRSEGSLLQLDFALDAEHGLLAFSEIADISEAATVRAVWLDSLAVKPVEAPLHISPLAGFSPSVSATQGGFAVGFATRSDDPSADAYLRTVSSATELGDAELLMGRPGVLEMVRSAAPLSNGALLALVEHEEDHVRFFDLACALPLTPEAELLRGELAMQRAVGAAALATVRGGVLVAFVPDESDSRDVRLAMLPEN